MPHAHVPAKTLPQIRFALSGPAERQIERLTLGNLFSREALDHDPTEPHQVHFNMLLWVETGRSSHMVDFVQVPLSPGTLLIIRTGQVHAFAAEKIIRGPILAFTDAFLRAAGVLVRELDDAFTQVLAAGPALVLEPAAQRLTLARCAQVAHAITLGERPFATAHLHAAAAELLFLLAGLPEIQHQAAARRPADPLVRQFLRQVEASFARERSTQFYAQKLHVSVRTLDRRIQAALGCTAKQALLERTLLEARRLLSRRDLSIKEVAAQLGFLEPHNFSRFFRSAGGQPPQSFRQTLAPASGTQGHHARSDG